MVNAGTKTIGDCIYFIVTPPQGERLDNLKRRWVTAIKKVTCANLKKLHEVANIDWVKPLDRSLQRILELGDAWATRSDIEEALHTSKSDVEKALLDDNVDEILAIMPTAAALVQRGKMQALPALYEALAAEEPPAIADCQHRFFEENMYTREVRGPCGMCGVTAEQQIDERRPKGFTKCASCGGTRCKPCAYATDKVQEEQNDLLRAYHEATRTHVWQPCPCTECDICKGPAAQSCACGEAQCESCAHACVWERPAVEGATCCLCLSDLGADSLAVCACGKSRCWECVSRTERPLWCYPADSTTFFVTDLQKMADNDKIAWLKHELDDEDAPLAQFAATFLYFFGEKICIELQKDKCLKLYRQYANVAKRKDLTPEQQKTLYSMRCRIPTEELTDFERVWDADAPQRCLGCAKAIHNTSDKGKFCSEACRGGGKLTTCIPCGNKVVDQGGVPVCTSVGCWVAEESALCAALKRSREEEGGGPSTLHIAGQLWRWPRKQESDPNHTLAWTKRRRL